MFKIRKKLFPEPGFELCEKKYEAHLRKYREYLEPDLIKYFYGGAFHDGEIETFQFDIENRTFSMVLNCPNFENENGEYVNIAFKLSFRDVTQFSLNCDAAVSSLHAAVFLQSEIGTVVSPRRNQSIIMELIPTRPPASGEFFISLVFHSVTIKPLEALAFRLLEESGKIHFNWMSLE